jgi:hypothetical protein
VHEDGAFYFKICVATNIFKKIFVNDMAMKKENNFDVELQTSVGCLPESALVDTL